MDRPKRIRRRIYLVKPGFQLKYTGLILLFMLAVAGLSGYTVYYTGWLLMGEKLANVYPQGRLVAIMRAINFTLIFRLALISPFVFLISILVSHKIAGPLFRIQKYIKSVSVGDLSARLTLRKGDELHDLAACINEMTNDLKNRVKKLKSLVNMSNLELDKLKRALGKELPEINVVKTEVEDLTKTLKELDDRLSEYRLTTVED
jgi:methyl-accepting chemotaxis protein